MFVIEGMDKVRKIIEEKRKRKLTKHKKISNNTVIEIDNCSPLEILKLQKNLLLIAQAEEIEFIFEKGKRRPEIQKLYEELEACGKRLMEYKKCFESMGKDRNSYSKTDLEATFMTKGSDPENERRSHAEWAVKTGLQRTDCSGELLYCPRICK